MKLAVFFLVPISAWLPTCNTNVVITHTEYDGHHKLAFNYGMKQFTSLLNPINLFSAAFKLIKHWTQGHDLSYRDFFGTHSSYHLKDNQIWTLECDHNEGYFYINNFGAKNLRLVQWGEFSDDTSLVVGRKSNNQLWKIYGNETRGYAICNYKYSNNCLAKWGLDDDKVGTLSHSPTYEFNPKLPFDPRQTWRITPLYYNPEMKWNRIEEIDNTRGEEPINLTVKYEVGVSSSTTDTISVAFSTELSLAVETLGSIGASFQSAIESSITNGRTETQTKTTQFKIQAGEHWWLCQGTATLDSWSGREDVLIISSQLKTKGDMC
jgi:hypothetical protein